MKLEDLDDATRELINTAVLNAFFNDPKLREAVIEEALQREWDEVVEPYLRKEYGYLSQKYIGDPADLKNRHEYPCIDFYKDGCQRCSTEMYKEEKRIREEKLQYREPDYSGGVQTAPSYVIYPPPEDVVIPKQPISLDVAGVVTSKKVYLSGPMTGLPGGNKEAFRKCSDFLREKGYDVVSPVEVAINKGAPWHECLRTDIGEMLGCTVIAVMDGSDYSKGAKLEQHVARELNFEFIKAETGEPLQDESEETILDEAKRIVFGARRRDYDHPLDNHQRIADYWSTRLERKLTDRLTPEEVADCMILLKLARNQHKVTRDNLVDIAGYAVCEDEIVKERQRRTN